MNDHSRESFFYPPVTLAGQSREKKRNKINRLLDFQRHKQTARIKFATVDFSLVHIRDNVVSFHPI